MTKSRIAGVISSALIIWHSAVFCAGQEQPRPVETGSDPTVPLSPAANAPRATDLPLNPPSVVCTGQQLTINANNSSLGSVLAQVQKCTGAQIDIPEGASANRVFDQLGPGPARQILTALLAETGFDFVIGSSDANPDKVESVLLMARAKDAPEAAVNDRNLSPSRRAYLQMLQNARPTRSAPSDNTQEPDPTPDTTPPEQPAAPPSDSAGINANPPHTSEPPSPPTGTAPASSANAVEAAPGPSPSSTQPGSAQDQITNMQQMFEQRQKMMQNQNPPQPQ